jgi:hypothetical protein
VSWSLKGIPLVALLMAGCLMVSGASTDGLPLDAARPGAKGGSATVVLDATLSVGGPTPRGLRLRIVGPSGRVVEGHCRMQEGAMVCRPPATQWYEGAGEYTLVAAYRAVDGVPETRTTAVTLHGDELEVLVGGYFDYDASLADFESDTVRSAPPGIELRVDGPPPGPGRRPPITFVNGSEHPVRVDTQHGVVGRVERLGRDGAWRAGRLPYLGCATGLVSTWFSPGESLHVSEVHGIDGLPTLAVGRHRVAVDFDDSQTLPESVRSTRRVWVEFEVAEGFSEREFEATYDWVKARRASERQSPRSAVPELTRPGRDRPAGTAGAAAASEGAPLLTDSAVVSGSLSMRRPQHVYRVDLNEADEIFVHLYARCVTAPCEAIIEAFPGWIGPFVRPILRNPPAWSTLRLQSSGSEDEANLVIGCGERCAAGASEFYGRVHIRRR